MALILSIETATPVCSVVLADGPDILGIRETAEKNSHSQVVSVFIDDILRENGIEPKDLSAVAVSMGRVPTPVCALAFLRLRGCVMR